jgi:transcriptional regulator with XRE-family HTH domain
MDFSERLRVFLKEKGINRPSEFASVCGFNHQTATNYFKGIREPTLSQIDKISQGFKDLNLQWLITGKGNMFLDVSDLHFVNSLPVLTSDQVLSFERNKDYPNKYVCDVFDDSTFIFRNTFDSLISIFNVGEYLVCKKVQSPIHSGIHLLSFQTHLLLQRVFVSDNQSLVLVNDLDNGKLNVNTNRIKDLYFVQGSIKVTS